MIKYLAAFSLLTMMTHSVGYSTTVGSLDPTFGIAGILTTDFGSTSDHAHAIALQSDGKTVVVGSVNDDIATPSDIAISRYNLDGSLDTSFGTIGYVTLDLGGTESLADVAIQTDQKIVATGYTLTGNNSQVLLMRFLSDGSLDPSFGTGGLVTTEVSPFLDRPQALSIQADGKIVVAGWQITAPNLAIASADYMLVRYNSNGSLDTSFGTNGIVVTDFIGEQDQAYDVALDTDGNIVVVGKATINHSLSRQFGVVRYDSNGNLDTSFSEDGKVTTGFSFSSRDRADAVAIQSDGRILVGGDVGGSGDFGIVRYNVDGTLDMSFGGDGKVTTDIAETDFLRSLAIDAEGKILAGGFTQNQTLASRDFALVRYNTDGSLDTDFHFDGIVQTDFFGEGDAILDIVLQSDGKVVAAGTVRIGGEVDFGLARYFLVPEPSTLVLFDIKPGSSPNSVNLKSKGVLPVAILGTEEFDVNDVDIGSLRFGDPLLIDNSGIAVSPLRSALEDVSGDGLLDLTLKFSTAELVANGALGPDTLEGLLTGELLDGTPFEGMDSIRIVPPSGSNGNSLQISTVPEPTTSALALAALCLAMSRRRSH